MSANGREVRTMGQPRFMTQAQMSELLNLWHLARVPLSGKPCSRYDRMLWATKVFGEKYPAIGATAAYKDLDVQLKGEDRT